MTISWCSVAPPQQISIFINRACEHRIVLRVGGLFLILLFIHFSVVVIEQTLMYSADIYIPSQRLRMFSNTSNSTLSLLDSSEKDLKYAVEKLYYCCKK